MSRRNYDPEKRLQRDVGELKDRLRDAHEVIRLQALIIVDAGLDFPALAAQRHAELSKLRGNVDGRE